MDNRPNWQMVVKIPDETLQRAFEFYCRSPDGQYDLIAAQCIALILENRRAGREGKAPR